MTDEMKIDSLADEYISQRKTIEKNEARILDFIKSKGIENVEDIALKNRLLEKGLSIQGWNELVLKSSSGGAVPGDRSGKGGGPGPGGSAAVSGLGLVGSGSGSGLGGLMDAISHLDVLLDSMEKQFDASDEQARNEHVAEIMKVFSDVNKQVDVMVMKVEHSVESLIKEVQSGPESVETAEAHVMEAAPPLHKLRRQILTSVAGIIKNISEPLSMINTSLEMIQSRTFGNVNPSQSSIIQVAKKNTDRIKNVLDRLASIGDDR